MKKIQILSCLLLLWSILSLPLEAQAQTTGDTVRVAFLPEMYGFYTIEDNGSYSGYNYDYLMNVAQHTNWVYEFIVIEEGTVSASLAKAEEMMIAGELDLVGPYSGTSARFNDFETGENNYGVYRYCYYSARNNYAVSRDNYFLKDNLTVGLVSYYTDLNEAFFRQIENSEFDVTPVYAQSHSEMIDMLLNEEVDTIINLDMSSHSEYLTYLTTVQRIPFYFASTKGNSALIADLDEAIAAIEIIEPEIHQRLLNTYFGIRYEGEFMFAEEETALLAEIDSFKVGFLSNVPPYQYTNDQGEDVGITIEILDKLEEIIGIPFEVYWYDNLQDLSFAIASEEIDLIGTLSNNYTLAHSLDVTLTTPYISGGVYWLRNENSSENITSTYHYVSGNIPFYNKDALTMVWDLKETLDTMEHSGGISVICDPNITDYYLSLYEYDNITVQAVSNVLNELSFGVGNHIDVTVIGMLNRAILFLDTYEVDELIFKHTSVKPEYSYWDLIGDHAFEINFVLILIVSCVSFSIYRTSRKFRELSRRDSLTKLYNSGYFHEYVENKLEKLTSGALILVDIDFFKDVNDTHGHHMGDEIIKEVAKNLLELGRSTGFYARVGGDEFALLLEGVTDKAQLEKDATEFLNKMHNNETGIPATLSIGAFLFQTQTEYKTLYKNADKVLYKVKENGRNGFLVTDTIDDATLTKTSNLLNHEIFKQKVTQLISTEMPSKNHALLLIHLKNMDKLEGNALEELTDKVVELIKNQVRQYDFLCSQEENSFLLFLSSCGTPQHLSECKQRIEDSLQQPIVIDTKEIQIQTKISVGMYPENGSTFVELMDTIRKKI